MTTDTFQKSFSKDFAKFKNSPLYSAILAVFEAASPARTEMSRIPGDVAAGGTVFFAQTQGHERLVELFRNGLDTPAQQRGEREPDYSSPQEI